MAGCERLEDRTLLTAYVVDTLTDTVASDGKLSLREAIQAANSNEAVNEAAAGEGGGAVDTITFAASISGGAITLGGTHLDVIGDLVVTGLGADRLTVSGNGVSRMFFIAEGVTARISGLTLTGGRAGAGGAVVNLGTLTADGVTVSGNSAAGSNGGGFYNTGTLTVVDSLISGNEGSWGGGILNAGVLTVRRTTVDGNIASRDGGGIHGSNARTTVVESTVSGNRSAGNGGGIYAFSGILNVTNSTISGNSTNGVGGGIRMESGMSLTGYTDLRNVTVVGNRADADGDLNGGGGGLVGWGNRLTLYNTLVAGNVTRLLDTPSDLSGPVESLSRNNLIADAGSAGYLKNGENGNIVGVDPASVLDLVLRDNGGPTKTHALLRGGRAVDAGSDSHASLLATDQRGEGFVRRAGGRVDIGAFELPNAPPVANDYRGAVAEDTPLEGWLVATDPEGGTLTFGKWTEPANGTATVFRDGRFVYTPKPNYYGTDTFTYGVSDGSLVTATVTITVDAVNDPPTLAGAEFALPENSPGGTVVGTLVGSDIDGDALAYAIDSGNGAGGFAIDNAGRIVVAKSSLLDYETTKVWTLVIRATDPSGAAAFATVTINITDVDDAIRPAIDIKPGDSTNTITAGKGTVEVAILSSATFDAQTVSVDSLRFGRTGAEDSLVRDRRGNPRYRLTDVDGDGRLDLVVTFDVRLAGFQVGDAVGVLTGRTNGGQAVEARSAVTVKSSGGKSSGPSGKSSSRLDSDFDLVFAGVADEELLGF